MDSVFIFSLLPVAFILVVVVVGLIRKVDVYTAFVKGARQGLGTAIKVLPYIIAMLMAIALFRAGGVLELVEKAVRPLLRLVGAPEEVGPLFLLRPFSGSAALSMLTDIYAHAGPDSFTGQVASVLMGSTETIFYTVALYFAAVGVERTRHTIPVALMASVVSLIASVWVCRWLL
ncbi:MAG: spore maturation protein [Bacillota bacterium]